MVHGSALVFCRSAVHYTGSKVLQIAEQVTGWKCDDSESRQRSLRLLVYVSKIWPFNLLVI